MQQTIDFLNHVLPDEGFYCAWQLEGKKTFWFDRREDLAHAILRSDAAGHTVYHACASFRQKSRRLAVNARSAASLWLDVDAGPGKPYADALAAAESVKRFLAKTGLPVPTYVSSGNGLHLYWSLVYDLAPDEWMRYARGLRALCQREGLAADTTRTCDLASILRTPGTHWRKSGERLVFAGPLTGPYELEKFEGLLSHGEQDRHHQRGHINGAKPRIAAAASILHANDSFSGERIGDRCGQLARLVETRGHILEPLRHACFGVLAHCEDGEGIAQECNERKNHAPYSDEEIAEKLDHWRQFGPTTCERFHALNPQVCEACPHWQKITSPIILGRQDQMEVGRGIGDVRQEGAPPENHILIPHLPEGFRFGAGGQLLTDFEDGNGPKHSLISANRLWVESVQRGETRGEYHVSFKHHVPALGYQDVNMKLGDVLGSQSSTMLANEGVIVHDHQSFARYVRAHAHEHMQTRVETQYEQFGWKINPPEIGFLYGLDLYGASGVKRVAGSHELQMRSRDGNVGPAPGGDLRLWTDAVDALFTKDCEAQAIALFASFGAPLVRLIDQDEGGVILHLVTAQSGTGKTWALLGSMSVWARKWGLRMTAETSQISKALTMSAIGNLPIFHDELTIRDPEELRSFITQFTEGTDKQRANRAGELKHAASTWQTVLVSASNMSIRDALTTNNQVHPMAARVIELNTELPKNVDFYKNDRWKKQLTENSGHAGAAYLSALVQPEMLAFAREEIDKTMKFLWDPARGFDSKHRYWIRGIAVMRVGALIAKHLGLIRVDVDAKLAWLWDRLKELGAPAGARPWSVEILAQYISLHRDHILAMPGPWTPHNDGRVLEHPKRDLKIRWELKGQRYLLDQSALRDWCTRQQISYRELVRELKDFRVVVQSSMFVTLGAGSNKPGPQVYCMEVDGKHPLMAGMSPPVEVEGNVVSLGRRGA